MYLGSEKAGERNSSTCGGYRVAKQQRTALVCQTGSFQEMTSLAHLSLPNHTHASYLPQFSISPQNIYPLCTQYITLKSPINSLAANSSTPLPKMAEKYLLRVTAGPTYDPSTHQQVLVNTPHATDICTPLLFASIIVRIQNYRGKFSLLPPLSFLDHRSRTPSQS